MHFQNSVIMLLPYSPLEILFSLYLRGSFNAYASNPVLALVSSLLYTTLPSRWTPLLKLNSVIVLYTLNCHCFLRYLSLVRVKALRNLIL